MLKSLLPRMLLPLALLCAATTAHAVDPINTGLLGNTAVKGYDVVAYQTENRPVKGSGKFVYEWKGAKWQFASAAHLKLFEQNPERYAPQYGGYCAYAVARDYTAGIDPEAWTVIGDKLYLNYSKDIQKQWEANRDADIASADRNWPKLSK